MITVDGRQSTGQTAEFLQGQYPSGLSMGTQDEAAKEKQSQHFVHLNSLQAYQQQHHMSINNDYFPHELMGSYPGTRGFQSAIQKSLDNHPGVSAPSSCGKKSEANAQMPKEHLDANASSQVTVPHG